MKYMEKAEKLKKIKKQLVDLHVRIPKHKYDKLQNYANYQGTTIAGFICIMIDSVPEKFKFHLGRSEE